MPDIFKTYTECALKRNDLMTKAENKLFDSLKELGVDIEGTISRFMDDDVIYTKFLSRFPDEDRITPIKEAAAAGDNGALLSTAHKLKGVSANLGMGALSAKAERIVSKLRNNISEGLDEDIAETEREYDIILENR